MSGASAVLETVHVGTPATGADRVMLQAMDAALHDLSQPLTSIALAMEVLANESDPATIETLLVAAREECARAMRNVEMLRVQTNRLLSRTDEVERGQS